MQTTKRGQKEGSSQIVELTLEELQDYLDDCPPGTKVPVRRKWAEEIEFKAWKREKELLTKHPELAALPEVGCPSEQSSIAVTEIDLDKE